MADIGSWKDEVRRMRQNVAKLGKEIPEVIQGFGQLHGAALKDGALNLKTKELICIAIGVALRCDGCIGAHVEKALLAGASRAEIAETLGVAIMMGGGPSSVYAARAMEALNEFAPVTAG